MQPAVPAVLVPRRHPEPRRARDAGVDPRGRRARVRAVPRLRRGVRQPRPAGRGGRRRRRGRDRAAGHQLALEQVRQPGQGRRRAADPAPQRLQDRQPDGAGAHPDEELRSLMVGLRPQAALLRGRLDDETRRQRPPPVRDAARRGARRDRRDQGRGGRRRRAAPDVADDRVPHAQGLDRARTTSTARRRPVRGARTRCRSPTRGTPPSTCRCSRTGWGPTGADELFDEDGRLRRGHPRARAGGRRCG